MNKVHSSKYTISRYWYPNMGYMYEGITVYQETNGYVPRFNLWPIQQYGRSDGHIVWNYVWGDPLE